MCVTLPVSTHSLSDHRLCVIFQQVPYVEVTCSIEYAEDRRSGLGPLQGDHRFASCTVLPLRHRLLMADCMQPDAAIATTHLKQGQRIFEIYPFEATVV